MSSGPAGIMHYSRIMLSGWRSIENRESAVNAIETVSSPLAIKMKLQDH